MLAVIWGFFPTFFFLYPTYLTRTEKAKTHLWDNHRIYMYAWFWFCGSHALLFIPFVVAWLQMSQDGGPLSFYSYWLSEIIIGFIVWIFILTELAFIGDILYEGSDAEDFSYSLIEPIIIAFFYPFLAFPTAYMINCDYQKAIDYYNPALKKKYVKDKEDEKNKSGSDDILAL